MRARQWIGLGLVLAVLGASTGCEGLKKKFIRKRKSDKGPEPIFALQQEYRPEFPPEIRYQAHFAYWKAAHDDLIDDLTTSTQMRRMRAVRQAIKELQAMQALLQGPQVIGLGQLIDEMKALEGRLDSPALDASRLAIFRSSIESLRRRIDKGYDYHKVKASLKPDIPIAAQAPSTDGAPPD